MAILRFVTHPQVRISADVPIPRWGLSDIGRARAEALTKQPWLAETTRLISSGETKALETAAIVAAAIGQTIEVREQLHENDRSATGFVPSDRFEVLADAFFAHPAKSVEGWETAHAAQQRIVHATADLRTCDTHNTHKPNTHKPNTHTHDTHKHDTHKPNTHKPNTHTHDTQSNAQTNEGDILIIGHGAVGTLLLCHLLRIPITRIEDQVGGEAAPGGGNYWSYDCATQTILHRWRPIDPDQ
jgi:broad specificity phosphatase PhoE